MEFEQGILILPEADYFQLRNRSYFTKETTIPANYPQLSEIYIDESS